MSPRDQLPISLDRDSAGCARLAAHPRTYPVEPDARQPTVTTHTTMDVTTCPIGLLHSIVNCRYGWITLRSNA